MKMQNLSARFVRSRVRRKIDNVVRRASLILFTDFLTPSVVLSPGASLRKTLRANRSRQFDLLPRGKGLKSCDEGEGEGEREREKKKGSRQ